MKRFILSTCAGLLAVTMAGPSFAADLPRPTYKAAPYYAPFSWSGAYVGINGGYSWGTAAFGAGADFDVDGAQLGGTIGYNLQTGVFVFGIEADADYSWADGNIGAAALRQRYLATVRGRIGYAFDRFLPFITGGAAYGDVRVTSPAGTSTDQQFGWVLGAGLEYAFASGWSAKAEYLYVDLSDASCGPPVCAAGTDVDYTQNIVRLGVNYRF